MKNVIVKSCVLLAIVGLLPACASLSLEPKSWPSTFDRESHLPSNSSLSTEILVGHYPLKGYAQLLGGGPNNLGLLGALISASIVNSQNEGLEQQARLQQFIRSALAKYNLPSKFREGIAETSFAPKLTVGYVGRQSDRVIPSSSDMLEKSDQDSVLLVDIGVKFSEDLSSMDMRADVVLLSKYELSENHNGELDHAKKSETTLYQNSFILTHQFVEHANDDDKPNYWWYENDGERRFYSVMDSMINSLCNNIQSDMVAI